MFAHPQPRTTSNDRRHGLSVVARESTGQPRTYRRAPSSAQRSAYLARARVTSAGGCQMRAADPTQHQREGVLGDPNSRRPFSTRQHDMRRERVDRDAIHVRQALVHPPYARRPPDRVELGSFNT